MEVDGGRLQGGKTSEMAGKHLDTIYFSKWPQHQIPQLRRQATGHGN